MSKLVATVTLVVLGLVAVISIVYTRTGPSADAIASAILSEGFTMFTYETQTRRNLCPKGSISEVHWKAVKDNAVHEGILCFRQDHTTSIMKVERWK